MIAFLAFQPVHTAFCIDEMKFWRRKRVGLLTSLKVSSRGEGVGDGKNRNAAPTPLPYPSRACDLHMENPYGHIEVPLNFLRWEGGGGGGAFYVIFQALSTSSKHGNSNILIVFAGQFWQGGGDIETFALQNQPVRWESSAGEKMLIVL